MVDVQVLVVCLEEANCEVAVEQWGFKVQAAAEGEGFTPAVALMVGTLEVGSAGEEVNPGSQLTRPAVDGTGLQVEDAGIAGALAAVFLVLEKAVVEAEIQLPAHVPIEEAGEVDDLAYPFGRDRDRMRIVLTVGAGDDPLRPEVAVPGEDIPPRGTVASGRLCRGSRVLSAERNRNQGQCTSGQQEAK